MKKYVIFDFNGTILNDVELCLVLLNEFLIEQNKPIVSIDKYKEIFNFPIRDYYIAAGLDLEIQSFEELANIYNEKYMNRSKNCLLYEEALDVFEALKENGIHMIVLSATEQNNLEKQLKYYGIYDYFESILGSNNYKGEGKIQRGLDYIKNNSIDKNDIILIGDSIHDHEVAQSLGCDCILYSKGHMSKSRLETTKRDVVDSLWDIVNYIEK